ncbi:hypothetical protein FOZ61_005443 [Perkinsus olseni]|uniref:Uncharacterized protein n=1 Tax=Perkinsus olseni TaxID=32597 RepID=A0A7J6MBF9_PEROL|nr:hypothetical protein FOZ61_005443 [Perkinsus olseni]
MSEEGRRRDIPGDLAGLSEADLAAIQELLERTAKEASDRQAWQGHGDGSTPAKRSSMSRRRHTVPDCSEALPFAEDRTPKIADRIFANAMISLSSHHRALWRQAEKELKDTPDVRATKLAKRRYSMPAVTCSERSKEVIPLIPSGIVSSLGLDDMDSGDTKRGGILRRRSSMVSTSGSIEHQSSQRATVTFDNQLMSNLDFAGFDGDTGGVKRMLGRHVNPAATDEESSFMNGKQFKAWLDNLFSSAEKSREDEMRLIEQRDPILSQYDPETMPLDNTHLHRHQQHHHSGAFFESADDTPNVDYDDAELGWD